MTKARLRGLHVLALDGRARISNVTDRAKRFVYWQTAEWLIAQGWARTPTGAPGDQHLLLTEEGHDAAKRELRVREVA